MGEAASLLIGNHHRASSTVYRHDLAISKACSRVAGSHHSRNSVLAGHQRGVGGQATTISDHGRRLRKEWRPGGRRRLSDKYLAGLEPPEILGGADDAHRASGAARAGGMANDRAWRRWTAGTHSFDRARHQAFDDLRRLSDGEGRVQAASAFPLGAPPLYCLPTPAIGVELCAGKEEDVLRLFDGACCLKGLPQAQHATPQQRPAEREGASLLLADGGE